MLPSQSQEVVDVAKPISQHLITDCHCCVNQRLVNMQQNANPGESSNHKSSSVIYKKKEKNTRADLGKKKIKIKHTRADLLRKSRTQASENQSLKRSTSLCRRRLARERRSGQNPSPMKKAERLRGVEYLKGTSFVTRSSV